jgi:DeoR/GlpR family transcriptional regulator of sugar metabolism
LRELAVGGLLQRVHGVALPSSPAVISLADRQELAAKGKVAIGRAAGMIERGQVVILDGGTTGGPGGAESPACTGGRV